MEKQITLVITRRAYSQIILPQSGSGYFHFLYVDDRYRRRGYGLELLKFAIQRTQQFLEMDIRYQSKVVQRSARRLGYRKIGPSDRYVGCELWRHQTSNPTFPTSRLQLLNTVHYNRRNGDTEVHYLSNSLDCKKRGITNR